MRVGDIGTDHPHVAAVLVTHRVESVLGGFVGCPATGQHQLTGAMCGQVAGDLEAYRP